MDFCWQNNVSAFCDAVKIGHSFYAKEQASFNFMAAATICSDFGTPPKKSATVSTSICHEMMGPDAVMLVF